MNKRNWRQIFFYVVEMTFAVIGGAGEAYIYWAYLPPSPLRVPEAIARAVITQVAIVFFGVAAVQATRSVSGFWRKFGAALPANIATLIASLVAFWFMRDAAIIFRDTTFLAPAEAGGVNLPTGAYIPGMWADIYLIAALPFFQVGLNWLAPIIVQDARVESADELETRQARELAEARHKAELRAVKVAGLHQAKEAAFGRLNPLQSDAANTPEDASESTGNDTEPTTGNETPSGQTGSGAKQGGMRVPAGMMTSPDFRRHLAREGIIITPEQAVAHVRGIRGSRRIGTTYAAPKGPLMRIANNLIAAAQTTGNEREEMGA